MQSYTSVDYHPKLDVKNAINLPKCKGAKYLLCIFGQTEEELIAKSWHRKYPVRKSGEVVVVFKD
jgi:hypothetical protein